MCRQRGCTVNEAADARNPHGATQASSPDATPSTEKAATGTLRAFSAIALLACLARIVLSHYVFRNFVDDAYIYLRYTENWSEGHGLVYNAGERVIAFTSYLFVILFGAIDKITGTLAATTVLKVFNLAMFGAYCAVLWRYLDRTRSLYWATAIFLLFYFPFIDATISGMESTLFLLIIAGTLLALRKGRFEIAVVLSAVAVITRPEGAMLLIPVCLVAFGHLSWKQRGRAALAAAAILSAVLVPLWVYFGTVLPHSMLAKSGHVTESNWAGIPTSPQTKALLCALGMSDSFYLELPAIIRMAFLAVFVVLLVAFVAAVVRAWRNKDWSIIVAAAFYLLVVAFYTVGHPVRIFSWYTIAPAVCFALVAIYGIEELAQHVESLRWEWTVAGLAAVLCAASIAIALPPRVRSVENHVGDLSRVGERIDHDYPDADSLLIADIGIIGYTTDLRIIDLAGLVSPLSVAQENGHKLSFATIVERSQPDVICLKNDPLEADTISESSLLHRTFDDEPQKNRFLQAYAPVDLGSQVCSSAFVRQELVPTP